MHMYFLVISLNICDSMYCCNCFIKKNSNVIKAWIYELSFHGYFNSLDNPTNNSNLWHANENIIPNNSKIKN